MVVGQVGVGKGMVTSEDDGFMRGWRRKSDLYYLGVEVGLICGVFLVV